MMNLTNFDKYPKRLMYCTSCKSDEHGDGMMPVCPKCGTTLATICFIGETGITGRSYEFPVIDFKTKLSFGDK